MTPRFLCPVLIGRDRELAEATAPIEWALAGQSSAVVVVGEAGIGKSRLVAEVRARAKARGLTCLLGRCFPEDRAFPLAPIFDLVRGAEDDALGEALASAAAVAEDDPRPFRDPASRTEKRRLFRALEDVLERLAASRGRRALLLVIEDLHWCDDTTLEWLLYLFRLTARPLFLLATLRRDDTHAALATLLAELERSRRSTEIALAPLGREEVREMMRELWQEADEPPAEVIDSVTALSDGNPLYVEELLRSHADGGGPKIPRSLENAVSERCAGLGAEAAKVLRTAAVAGRRFDASLIGELLALDDAALTDIVKELVGAQLLVEDSAESFSFRHALTHEIVRGSLLARERRAIHRSIAAILERRLEQKDGERDRLGLVSALSHHFHEAGDARKTARWARRAGELALEVSTPRAAAAHFGRAIEAHRRLGEPAEAALLRQRAHAHEWQGDFELAREDHRAALSAARAAGDARAEHRALLDLAVLSREVDFAHVGDLLEQALAIARGLPDAAPLARTLSWIGFWRMMSDEPHLARAHQEEALETFRALDDRRGLAEAFDHLGWTHYVCADLRRSDEAYRRAAELFEALGDRQGLAGSLAGASTRGADYFQLPSVWGEVAAEPRAMEEAIDFARRIEWRSGVSRARIWAGLALGPRGAYREAFAHAREGLRIATEDGQVRYAATAHILLGALHLDRCAPEAAREELDRAIELAIAARSSTVVATAASFRAQAALALGDIEGATAVLDAAAARETEVTMPARLLLCVRAEIAIARGEAKEALATAGALIEATPSLGGDVVVPRLEHLRGSALAKAGRHAEACAVLEAAARSAVALGQRSLAWRILAAQAGAAWLDGREAEAERAAAEARMAVEALAAHQLDDGPERERFLEAALASVPRPTARRRARAPDELTRREEEIVERIAEGLSNRAIAKRLHISERTVERHVENVLSKLGFSSRVQIAVWVAARPRS